MSEPNDTAPELVRAAGEVHLSQESVEASIDTSTCPVCGEPADGVELIVDAAGGHLIWNPCRHESEVEPDAGD